ncbi:MAG: DUF1778 domain-containing protein [Acidimicrobiia bacterium]
MPRDVSQRATRVDEGQSRTYNVHTINLEYDVNAEQRDSRWNFRVKAQSDALVREAATLMGTSKTAFVEDSAVTRARSLIAEHQPVVLSYEEFSRFVDGLDEAPVTVSELVDLFAQTSQIPAE